MKKTASKVFSEETGMALILVLVLMVVGCLTILPALAHIGSALKTSKIYEDKTDMMYAADAGIEDAIWQIKYDMLDWTFAGQNYDIYNYNTTWTYELDNTVNDLSVNVSIENVWIPSNVTLSGLGLTAAQARSIMERSITDNTTNRLITTGTNTETVGEYRIKIDFYPFAGNEEALTVDSIGIWLPHGFTYAGGCNLNSFAGSSGKYAESTADHSGGQVVVWDFTTSLPFADLPPVELDPSDMPQSAEITFNYTTEVAGTRPTGISWIVTDGAVSSDIPISWDIDTKIYKIIASAGDTEIEAYPSRSELRNLSDAISGDYVATGNSLMQDKYSHDGVRDTLMTESSATIDSIPNDPDTDVGDVLSAYLYWSAFRYEELTTPVWGPDTCEDLDNWVQTGTVWQIDDVWDTYGGYVWDDRFFGRYNSSDTDDRYLELDEMIDLSSYSEGELVVEWKQEDDYTLEPTDGVTFQLSSDNGTSWSDPIIAFYDDVRLLDYSEEYFYYVIPDEYLTTQFKVKFHLEDTVDEYCIIDDIAIAQITGTADTSVNFKIDKNDDGVYEYDSAVTASESSVLGFHRKGQHVYSCFLDVTDLVEAYAENVTDEYGKGYQTGNAEYVVGGVDGDLNEQRSYAGWSLIIVYASPETAGHQLYLFDTLSFNSGYASLDFDNDGVCGGDISGFIIPEQIEGDDVAARLTCFAGEGDLGITGDFLAFNAPDSYRSDPGSIPTAYKLWDGTTTSGNSESYPNNAFNSTSIGMTESGVDIDTFTITWSSGLLHADDTSAHVDPYTLNDNWILVYMILSVRSETTVGGTVHYIIHQN